MLISGASRRSFSYPPVARIHTWHIEHAWERQQCLQTTMHTCRGTQTARSATRFSTKENSNNKNKNRHVLSGAANQHFKCKHHDGTALFRDPQRTENPQRGYILFPRPRTEPYILSDAHTQPQQQQAER